MKKIIRLTESDLVKLVKRVIKEEEEQEVISQVENNPTASDAAESVKSLTDEEQDLLGDFIKSNPKRFKELVQNELESQNGEELTEEDEDYEEEIPKKKSFEDEYGMTRKEFDIRKLIHKIVGYSGVAAGLAVVPAAALISGGVAVGLGITALAGYLLKDAAFYQRKAYEENPTTVTGPKRSLHFNYDAARLADYEDGRD